MHFDCCLLQLLEDAAGPSRRDAPTVSHAVDVDLEPEVDPEVDPEPEAYYPPASVHHSGSQCNIRPLRRSSGNVRL